jgi:hypothetical protein
MKATLMQIVSFALGLYLGWQSLVALRTGEITLYQRFNRSMRFSRESNPAAFWLTAGLYLLFAAVAVFGLMLRLLS